MEHFDRGQTLCEWNPTNVIEGLLLQPKINQAWLGMLDTLDPFSRQNLSWDNNNMPALQQRLEMGVTTETARQLAQAAYDLAEFDWTSHITTSSEANYTSTRVMVPPPRLNQAYIRQCSSASATPASKQIDYTLPIAHSATKSLCYAYDTSPSVPYTGNPIS